MSQAADPIVTFYRMIPSAPLPIRADRSAVGLLPTRATRYCDAVTTASGFGWYVFPPMELQFLFDGHDIAWTYDEIDEWLPLRTAQYPYMSASFDEAAPAHLVGCSPPFLAALPEAGVLQMWTGLLARTAPDWSLNVRPPANLWVGGGYTQFEGVVETDRWFGPLFTNIRLTRTNVPVRIRVDMPLLQVQALPRSIFHDEVHARVAMVETMAAFQPDDWSDYQRSIVDPSDDPARRIGQYAIAARRRRAAECPFASGTATRADRA